MKMVSNEKQGLKLFSISILKTGINRKKIETDSEIDKADTETKINVNRYLRTKIQKPVNK